MRKTYTCNCGFQWEHGRSGDHQCGPFYRDRIEALEKQNAELQSTLRKLIEQFETPCRDERVLIQQAMKVLDK